MKFKKYYAVIAAGGQGSRLESDIPKQFIVLNNKPVLFYSLKAFSKSMFNPELIVALNSEYKDYWVHLCKKHCIYIKHKIVKAGINRSETIKNAINAIENADSIVAIHDGARPLISTSLIDKLYETAINTKSAVPVLSLVDAIAKNTISKAHNLNKNNFYLIQTPQCFVTKEIMYAYKNLKNKSYQDDASLMEATGIAITKVNGERSNLKITYNSDLIIAKAFLDYYEE